MSIYYNKSTGRINCMWKYEPLNIHRREKCSTLPRGEHMNGAVYSPIIQVSVTTLRLAERIVFPEFFRRNFEIPLQKSSAQSLVLRSVNRILITHYACIRVCMRPCVSVCMFMCVPAIWWPMISTRWTWMYRPVDCKNVNFEKSSKSWNCEQH